LLAIDTQPALTVSYRYWPYVIATPTPINTLHRLSQPVLIWSRLKKLASQIGEYVLTDIAFSLSLTFNYGLITSTYNRLKLFILFLILSILD
jgi:hypothetical protein